MMPSDAEHLDPRVITLWRLQGLLRLGTFWLPVAVVGGMFLGGATTVWLGFTAGAVVILANLALAVLWPPLEWNAFRYVVREDDLLVQSGVLFRRWSAVPRSRIQHVDTRQGPLERALGLARLQVFTAAGMSADGSMPGLAESVAERLRDELSRQVGDDGV